MMNTLCRYRRKDGCRVQEVRALPPQYHACAPRIASYITYKDVIFAEEKFLKLIEEPVDHRLSWRIVGRLLSKSTSLHQHMLCSEEFTRRKSLEERVSTIEVHVNTSLCSESSHRIRRHYGERFCQKSSVQILLQPPFRHVSTICTVCLSIGTSKRPSGRF